MGRFKEFLLESGLIEESYKFKTKKDLSQFGWKIEYKFSDEDGNDYVVSFRRNGYKYKMINNKPYAVRTNGSYEIRMTSNEEYTKKVKPSNTFKLLSTRKKVIDKFIKEFQPDYLISIPVDKDRYRLWKSAFKRMGLNPINYGDKHTPYILQMELS